MIAKIYLCLLGVLAAALSATALYFTALPVFSIVGWGWWSALLIPASWVAGISIGLAALAVGVLMYAIWEETK